MDHVHKITKKKISFLFFRLIFRTFFIRLFNYLDLNSSDRISSALLVDDGHTKLKSITKSVPPPLPKLPPPVLHRRYRNFRSLSANVQRLISHSNTSLHPDDMNELHSVDNHPNHPNNGNYDHKNRSTTTNTSTAPTTNGSKFKHPLSKNTCQLTKSGNDLVIDDSDGGYATPPEIIPQSMANEYRYLTKNDHENPDDPDDLDKTPTNQCPLIQFEHVLDQLNGNNNTNHNDGIGIDDEYETVCMVHENNLINEESSIAPKKSFIHSFASKVEPVALKTVLSNESKSDNSLQSSPTLSQKSTDSETKMIKSQLFTIKAQVSEQSSKNSSLERNSLLTDDMNLENNIENNYETIDEPIVDVSVPASVNKIDSPTKCDQINIDLKRIKVRPLSSVSISSTSSSSSSASDEHSTNQTAISYLASVESLADHSENELVALSATLTVTERACLEIVDSERSYVDDLGQVIKG